MIVPMKRLTVLCVDHERENAVTALRSLGVLHLGTVPSPDTQDGEKLLARLTETRQASKILDSLAQTKTGAAPETSPSNASPADAVKKVLSLHAAAQELKERLARLSEEEAAAIPFGEVDAAAVEKVRASGIHISFGRDAGRQVVVPEGVASMRFHSDRSGTFVALVSTKAFENPYPTVAPPPRGVSAVVAERETVVKELRAREEELTGCTPLSPLIKRLAYTLAAQGEFLAVRENMGAAHSIAWLRGFCPVPDLDRVRAAASRHGWGLIVEEPSKNDPVPTLIRSPAWVRPIEPLFKAIKIVPGYHEPDVSMPFLLFFSVFFAMIVGDAGYGLIFLLMTIAARLAMRKAPSQPFALLAIFSVCTMVWGVITGTYFGIAEIGGILERARIQWLMTNENVMKLCLIIGGVHLSLAHLWNAIRTINSTRALAQLGWIGLVWTVYFAALAMFGWSAFPSWYIPVAIASMILIVLFMTPPSKFKEEWINHAMLPLTLMSSFADMLSYLRLFALGVASLELAKAFNTMALGVGFESVIKGFGAALILFLGHALNIGLSAMSVLVHALRLNALEFSMHLGLEWSGIEYKPFREEQLTE